jgi:hypothetical protein
MNLSEPNLGVLTSMLNRFVDDSVMAALGANYGDM